jgi:phenylacetate-CoA ligase
LQKDSTWSWNPATGNNESHHQQLSRMLSHAARHSPYYREQDWAVDFRAGKGLTFADIPITPRALVQEQTALFYSGSMPAEAGKVRVKYTSGSTGTPMQIRTTDQEKLLNRKENIRLRRGWGVKSHRKMAQILFPDKDRPVGWRKVVTFSSGNKAWLLSTLDADEALDWIRQCESTLVHAFPSIMLGVLQRGFERSQDLPIQLIGTVSEVVSDELRELVRKIPGCRLMDHYGSEEGGLMAVQCPVCDAYHPGEKLMRLEILADNDAPAKPGEMGRVVISPLFNYAMPLVRYETGDYAVAGESGRCTRSDQSITRIVGRESGLFKLPGGGKVAAMLPSDVVSSLNVKQYKLFQTSLADVELHYVPRSDTAMIKDSQAQAIVDRYISPEFKVRCLRVSEIPRLPNGKYLMHESLI